MGKTRKSANLVAQDNITSDIDNMRVGICNTTPGYVLDVNGDLNVSGTIYQDGDEFSGGGGGAGLSTTGFSTSYGIHIDPTGAGVTYSEDLVVVGNARVTGILSIGTSSIVLNPVDSSIKLSSDSVIRRDESTGDIRFLDNSGNLKKIIANEVRVGSGNTVIVIGRDDSTGNIKFTDNSGNLKKITADEIRIGTGSSATILRGGSSGTLKLEDSTGTETELSSGGGGGSNQLGDSTFISLDVVDTASFTKFPISQYEGAGITQLNDTQFAYGSFGYTSSNVRCYGQPFQVDANGNITTGSQAYASNSSGSSVSTTVFGEPHPGDLVWFSRCHYSSSYTIMSFGLTVSSNNTCSAGRYAGSDYNSSGYAHPQSGNAFGTKSGSTKYAWYGGYGFGSSRSGYVRWQYNGSSHYTHSTGSQTSSYSSTTGCHPALQHHSNTAAPVGVMHHRDGNSSGQYYYVREYNGSSYSNLGWANTVLGTDRYNNIAGFRMDDGKAVYVYYDGSGGYVTNGSGSLLKSNASITGWGGLSGNESYANRSMIALGNDYFAIPTSLMWNIVKITLDGSYNPTFNVVASLFVAAGTSIPSQTNQYIGWRLAGANQQYVVVAQNGNITTYDATPLTNLMV